MSADAIVDRLIAYSLFRRDILSSETDLRPFVGDYFGVFVTIRRAHRLGTWPDDIHGCIGYWEPSYGALTPQQLWDHAREVGYRAVWEDSRRHRFDHFLDRDPDTWLEVDLMRRPLHLVDGATGMLIGSRTVFTNDRYGLIVQHPGPDGARATYLPHVFDPSMPWTDLRDHLIAKAGIGSNTAATPVFYAYTVIQYKRQLHQVLDSPRIGKAITQQYLRQLIVNKNERQLYPFMYEVNHQGRRRFEEHEEVRNLSTLMNALLYDDAYGGLLDRNDHDWLRRRCEAVLTSQIQTLTPQALSFAGYVVQKYTPALQGTYCRRLLYALPHAEPEFEQGEILRGLRTAGCTASVPGLNVEEGHSIFRMNWTVQAMVAWGKPVTADHRQILLSAVDGLLQDEAETETNVLAVAWEMMCAVYSVSQDKSIKDRMFALFFHLERRRIMDGFYVFRSGDARMDITDHVLHGFLYGAGMKRQRSGGGRYRRTHRRRFKHRTRKHTKTRRVTW